MGSLGRLIQKLKFHFYLDRTKPLWNPQCNGLNLLFQVRHLRSANDVSRKARYRNLVIYSGIFTFVRKHSKFN